MALVSKMLLHSLLMLALCPFGSYGVSSKKLQGTPDHGHMTFQSEHHNQKHSHDKDHSRSYTHRHGPGLPEHTHDESQSTTVVVSGFVFLAYEEESLVTFFHQIVLPSFPELEVYFNIFSNSIFRPPIA